MVETQRLVPRDNSLIHGDLELKNTCSAVHEILPNNFKWHGPLAVTDVRTNEPQSKAGLIEGGSSRDVY